MNKDKEELNKQIKEINEFFAKKVPWYTKLKFRLWEYMWMYLPMHEIYRNWYKFLIWLYGFKLVKCVDYAGEYTFIFKTSKEAHRAHKILEDRKGRRYLVTGWWYGEMEFDKIKNE